MDAIPDVADATGGAGGLTALLRRHRLFIVGWTLGVTALAVCGIVRLTPQYRAEAMLMLSTRTEHLSDLKSVVSGPLPAIPDPNVARGEVEVLRGRLLAQQVIEQLGLENNPDLAPHHSLLDTVLRSLSEKLGVQTKPLPAPTAAQRMAGAVDAYLKRFGAFNDGRSFTLSLSYASLDPELAARVTNAHAELYLNDQRRLKDRAASRAIAWLQHEVLRLHSELETKQQAIRDRREQAGLVGSAGATGLERQVTDIGTSLAQARADVALRRARLDAARNGDSNTQSSVLDSDLIHKLREQEAQSRQRLAGLAQRYGNNFPEVTTLRLETADLAASIAQETARIVRSLQSDLATAQQSESGLEGRLADLQNQRDKQARAAADVDDMEHDAQATRSVYETLLARLSEIQAQAGAEEADARLISPAAAPPKPYFPNVPLFGSVALIAAMASGTGFAWLIERRNRAIMQANELTALGLTALEPIPFVSRRERRGRAVAELPLSAPKSVLADQVRALHGDIALLKDGETPRVFAITSALPGEGKTTMALMLGRSMAASGLQILVIECDLRRPTVARALGVASHRIGLVAVLRDGISAVNAAAADPISTMRVIAAEQVVARPQDLLQSSAFRRLLSEARETYDYVLLDTPPLGAVSDAMLVAPHADGTLLVVRWNTTPAAVVKAVARKLAGREQRIVGAILNATDLKRATPDDLAVMYRAGRTYARRSYSA